MRNKVFFSFTMLLILFLLLIRAAIAETKLTNEGIKFPDGTTQTTSASGATGLWSSSDFDIYYNSGNVGIGTTNPLRKFHVHDGTLRLSSGTASLEFKNGLSFSVIDSAPGGFDFQSLGASRMVITERYDSSGIVGIGTTEPQYELDVIGDIRATGSVYYGGSSGSADGTPYYKPDYVFESGYSVLSTDEVIELLKKEKSLPWITSRSEEKKENGEIVDMTRMAFETVETVENLQLQIIELSKIIKKQQKQIDYLMNKDKE